METYRQKVMKSPIPLNRPTSEPAPKPQASVSRQDRLATDPTLNQARARNLERLIRQGYSYEDAVAEINARLTSSGNVNAKMAQPLYEATAKTLRQPKATTAAQVRPQLSNKPGVLTPPSGRPSPTNVFSARHPFQPANGVRAVKLPMPTVGASVVRRTFAPPPLPRSIPGVTSMVDGRYTFNGQMGSF